MPKQIVVEFKDKNVPDVVIKEIMTVWEDFLAEDFPMFDSAYEVEGRKVYELPKFNFVER